MALDIAGNYIFDIEGEEYRIMKMNIFQQREFLGVIKHSFNVVEDGSARLDLYSVESDKAQDWVLPRISHKSGDKYTALSGVNLEVHLDEMAKAHNTKPLIYMNSVFIKGVNELLENFTGSVEELTPQNSSQNAGESSENTNTQNLLSQTLNR